MLLCLTPRRRRIYWRELRSVVRPDTTRIRFKEERQRCVTSIRCLSFFGVPRIAHNVFSTEYTMAQEAETPLPVPTQPYFLIRIVKRYWEISLLPLSLLGGFPISPNCADSPAHGQVFINSTLERRQTSFLLNEFCSVERRSSNVCLAG